MGYNTTVIVLNDRLYEIENDPEFGKKLATAIRWFSPSHPGRELYITGQTQIIHVAHADDLQIIAAGGNTARVIDELADALRALLHEVIEAGFDSADDYGWPTSIAAARAALAKASPPIVASQPGTTSNTEEG